MSAGSILLIMLIISIAVSPYDSGMDSLFGLICVYLFILSMSLIIKIICTLSLRTLFIATDVEIRSGKVTRKGFKVKRSIQWQDVTKIDVDPFILTIQNAQIEIRMKLTLDNYEPLFEIMRAKVPRKALTSEASDFISRPVATIPPGTMIMRYDRWGKIFLSIISIALWAGLWGAYIFAPGDKTLISWTGVFLFVLSISPIIGLLELSHSYFVLSAEGIERRSFYLKNVFIPWNEVESIRYKWSNYGGAYYVRGAGKKIELDGWLDGMPQFSKYVVNKVPPERWDNVKMDIMKEIRD
ncbi:MAG: hypothetical protein GXX95_06240 [Methanomassiliicoccus sp.]|nr:hypothetical protein [Methanomassiliicoccus sp.]